MQIHELNNYNGALDSDAYVAVDNGEDTGKVGIPALLNQALVGIEAANERIDNIITSPAPSEEEIIDARIGANGYVYSSLGAAIRDQIDVIGGEIQAITPNLYVAREDKSNSHFITIEDAIEGSTIINAAAATDSTEITQAMGIVAQGSKNLLPYMANISATALGLTFESVGNGGYRIHGTSTGTGNVYLNRSGAFAPVPLTRDMYICANNAGAADGLVITLWSGTAASMQLSLANIDAKTSVNLSGALGAWGTVFDGIQIYCSKANTAFDVTIYPVVTFDLDDHAYEEPSEITPVKADIVSANDVSFSLFPIIKSNIITFYARTNATSISLALNYPEETLSEKIEDIQNVMTVTASPDESDIIENRFIQSDGDISPKTNNFNATDYIDISGIIGDELELSCTIQGNASAVIFDEDKTVLMYINGTNASDYGITGSAAIQQFKIEKPSGAYYARLSALKSSYTGPSDLYVKGLGFGDLPVRVSTLEKIVSNDTPLVDKKILVIGDSISADAYGNYDKWVTDLINIGAMSSALVTNSSQHATGFVADHGGDYDSFLTRLQAVQNPSTFDLVVVFGGINDYVQNIPMGEPDGVDYTVSFKPAVNEFFDYLVNNFTQARLCVLLPLRTYQTWVNTENEYQQAYGDYINTVAKSYCLPVLDLTNDSGFCPFVQSFRDMWTLLPQGYNTHDGTHPTEEYERKYLAPMILSFLEGLIR